MVAELGFEPRQTESESVVLPLHNSATFEHNYSFFFANVKRFFRSFTTFFKKEPAKGVLPPQCVLSGRCRPAIWPSSAAIGRGSSLWGAAAAPLVILPAARPVAWPAVRLAPYGRRMVCALPVFVCPFRLICFCLVCFFAPDSAEGLRVYRLLLHLRCPPLGAVRLSGARPLCRSLYCPLRGPPRGLRSAGFLCAHSGLSVFVLFVF